MSSTVIKESPNAIPADVLLAEKTLEIIRVMEMSLHILKTRFNDNPDQWMKAMFHVLKLRNLEYLREECHVHSESESLCQKVHDNITRMYSEIEAQKQSNRECDIRSRDDFISTASSLTTLFRKFTNLLVKTEDSFINSDILKDMKLISGNITNFISKYERENAKNAGKNEIIRKETSSAIPCKTPSTGSTLNDESKIKNSKPNHKEPIVTDGIPYLNPVFSTLNKKIIANNTAKNVGASTSTSTTPSLDNSSIPKPWRLHESDRSLSVDSLNKNLPITSLVKQLNSSLGDKSEAIKILNDREFYCKVCNCPISAWQNVIAHIQGKPHSKNLNSMKGQSKKQPTDGTPKANDDVRDETTQSRSTSNLHLEL